MKIILGLDPAIKNFGYSVIGIDPIQYKWKLIECGIIKNPINKLDGNFSLSTQKFKADIDLLSIEYKPVFTIIERFMNRHKLGQSMTEKVGIMIGIASSNRNMGKVQLVTPGVWKTRIKRFVNIDDIYKETKLQIRKKSVNKEQSKYAQNQVNHCVDSTILSILYGMEFLKISDALTMLIEENISSSISGYLIGCNE